MLLKKVFYDINILLMYELFLRSYGVRHRQDGNIRRFTADEDSDSENATWNGNSTQQM